jgi:peptide/nickel transport system permease protein
VLSVGAGFSLSVPVFVIGTLAILVLAQQLRLTSAGGCVAFATDPLRHIALLLMPACTIAIGLGAGVFRVMRASVLEVLDREHVRTARRAGCRPPPLSAATWSATR